MNIELLTQENFYTDHDNACADRTWDPAEVLAAFQKNRQAVDRNDHKTMADMLAKANTLQTQLITNNYKQDFLKNLINSVIN